MAIIRDSLTFGLMAVMVGVATYLMTKEPESFETKELNYSYDYIVVGSGSAGSVLASRLTEDPNISVLLLEAGGNDDVKDWYIPLKMGWFDGENSDIDWYFHMEPLSHACLGWDKQRTRFKGGRVLGGSSILNYMMHTRGSRHDYDGWAADGCNGWGYNDVLPYFLKSENMLIEDLASSKYHSVGGPLSLTDTSTGPLVDIVMQAATERGHVVVDRGDCNGEFQTGFCHIHSTIQDGERASVSRAFLRPAMARLNLHVGINSFVTKVVVENKRAVGVSLFRNGQKQLIIANKEIVLSAGAIGSPRLLLLSGIGPKDQLQKLNIPVHADLPVGEQLQSHVGIVVKSYVNASYGVEANTLFGLRSSLQHQLLGTGYLGQNGGLSAAAYVHSDNTSPENSRRNPDMQLIFQTVWANEVDPYGAHGADFAPELRQSMAESSKEFRNNFNVFITGQHPRSKGTVRLRSSDPFDPPVIDPNYLHNSADVKTILKGYRLFEDMLKTKAFRSIDASPYEVPVYLPACARHISGSDAYWECVIRHLTFIMHHYTSTCKMGGPRDPEAVVDLQLRVKGISGLRVADASIMPSVVSGNTNAPTVMIGEKAADFIRGIDSVKHFRDRFT